VLPNYSQYDNQIKKPKTQPDQGRDVRRVARFPCHGYLYITLHDAFFDCVLNHPLDHARYKDISIPEKWREYIMDNHNFGPMKVRTAFKWVNDNLKNITHRTCPKTNEKDRQRQPLPRNVMVYMFVENENGL